MLANPLPFTGNGFPIRQDDVLPLIRQLAHIRGAQQGIESTGIPHLPHGNIHLAHQGAVACLFPLVGDDQGAHAGT